MGLELRPSITEAAAPTPLVETDEFAERSAASPRLRRWLKWAALLLVCIALVDAGASQLVRPARVRRRLDARLEAAFGRPVEVDRYSFSLWGGPTLEADGIRVDEDPRFGHEYFLSADSLSVRLRWLSLLRGRFELESLSLSSPVVNVVNAGGDWNLAEWLGHAAAPASNYVGPIRVPFVPSFRKIQVQDGRIYFKRGDDKLPFAFVSVEGTIAADGPQRWRLDLEAAPWRAAELLQQAGTIHLAGSMGGTSSALRPASLQVSWSDASIPDFLRLMTGDDSGIRGTLAIGLNAQTSANGWSIQGEAQLGELHRWDLLARTDAPSLSVNANMALDLPGSTLEISSATIEAPRSNLRGSGRISWGAQPAVTGKPASGEIAVGRNPGASLGNARGASSVASTPAPSVAFGVESASIDFADALSWLRSFRTNVPETLVITGFAQARGSISGWPARVTNFAAETDGAEISGGQLANPVRLGETHMAFDGSGFQMLPATIAIAGPKDAPAGSFRLDMSSTEISGSAGKFASSGKRKRSASPGALAAGIHLAGGATDAGAVIAVANAFGWDVARGWQIAGPVHCDLRWPQLDWPWKTQPVGMLSLGSDSDGPASLRAPFLNLPVSGLQVRMDMKPGVSHVTLAAAQAFGARWTGTFDRADSASQWQFALAADRMNTADLDRWLNPQWRESFIDRMLPFLNSGAPPTAVPDSLRAAGRFSVGQFSAASLVLQSLAGDLSVNGRKVVLDSATAQLLGGKLSGSLQATLAAIPSYQIHANFSGVNIAPSDVAAQPDSPALAGMASGEADISMQGTAASDLAQSLDCKGAVDVRNAAWHGVGLIDSLATANLVPGSSAFSEASAQFTCADSAIALQNIVLTNDRNEIDGEGTVDFARAIDLQLHVVPGMPGAVGPVADKRESAANAVRVTGTIAAPEFSRAAAAHRPR